MPYGGVPLDQKTTHGTSTGLVKTYYDKRLIERLEPKTYLHQLGDKRPIPGGTGKTIEFTGYRNIFPILTNSSEITAAQTYISAYTISASLIQRHNYVMFSTLLKQTSIDPNVSGAVDALADQMARTVELYLRYTIVGGVGTAVRSSKANATVNTSTANDNNGTITGTSAQRQHHFWSNYPCLSNQTRLSTSGADIAVMAGSAMTVNEIRYGVNFLRSRNVPTPDGSPMYVLYCHPLVVDVLQSDPSWRYWNAPQQTLKTMYKGEVGNVMGTRIIQSSCAFRYIYSAAPLTTASGAFNASFLVGKQAFGVTEINGGAGRRGFEIIVKTPGPNSTSDPANLFSTVAGKMTMTAAVLNKSAAACLITTDRVVSSAS